MIPRPLVADDSVFDDEHLPRRLQHRDGAVSTLSTAIEPTLRGDEGDDVLIAGPSGVGKTALSLFTLGKLDERAAIDYAHIGCLGSKAIDIYHAILREVGGTVASLDASTEDCRRSLREAIDRPTIVVLDEAAGLLEPRVIQGLLGIPQLSVVVICHDPDDWLANAPDRVRDHFGGADIVLSRYGVDELADILRDRARVGLQDGAVSQPQLESIADETAGVARYGIQALFAAAEIADEHDRDTILDEDIEAAYPVARQRIRRWNLESLGYHHHVLYTIIYRSVTIDGGKLHDEYDRVAEQLYSGHSLTPVVRRTRLYKLEKLKEYDLITYDGPKQSRTYRVMDRDVEPPLDLPAIRP